MTYREGQPPPALAGRQPRGVRDFFAKKALARDSIIEKIRRVYELYGYEPLYTPAIERLDVLVRGRAGQEAQDSIYRVTNLDNESLGLRFDLTVPLARVIRQTPELRLPFRRYQVASVWRRERPERGRYREFMQFDLDAVGVAGEVGDTEIIAAMCDVLHAVGAGPFVVRFSSRGILKALLAPGDGSDGRVDRVFEVIDKVRDKVGKNSASMDGNSDATGEAIKGLGLAPSDVEMVKAFLKVNAPRRAAIAQLRELFAHVAGAVAEIGALEHISNHLYALGYGDDVVRIDPYVTRGLEYYTGTVFESTILEAPGFGSVFSGGRYDGLVVNTAGKKLPCTGASIGVDRLVEALQDLGRLETKDATTKVFVAVLKPTLMSEYMALTWELRRQKIPTELYLGTESFGEQLSYASRRGVPVVLVYGTKEHADGVVSVKDLATEEQIPVPRAEVAQRVAAMLKEIDDRERARGS